MDNGGRMMPLNLLPPSATVVSAKQFSHRTGRLWCLQREMATYRHWSVSLWWGDVSHCGKMMSHIVESCPLTKLNGGLSRLHSADEDAVSWLTSYGSWHAYNKKKKIEFAVWQPPAVSVWHDTIQIQSSSSYPVLVFKVLRLSRTPG